MQEQGTVTQGSTGKPGINADAPEGALFVLNSKLGNEEGTKLNRIGYVIRNENSQFDSYLIVNAERQAINLDGSVAPEGKLGLVIDVSKAGDLYLKAPNPAFDASKPADFKVNSRFNIVTTLYPSISKGSGQKYYRATVGGKDMPEPKTRYMLFSVDHVGANKVKKSGTLG
jgi:hypothetical protein